MKELRLYNCSLKTTDGRDVRTKDDWDVKISRNNSLDGLVIEMKKFGDVLKTAEPYTFTPEDLFNNINAGKTQLLRCGDSVDDIYHFVIDNSRKQRDGKTYVSIRHWDTEIVLCIEAIKLALLEEEPEEENQETLTVADAIDMIKHGPMN